MTKEKIGEWNGVPVYLDLLPIGTRRTGQPLDGTGIPKACVIHDTGNINTTAQGNINYFKNTYLEPWNSVSSAHGFVDDKEFIICIPVTEKAWHVLYDTPFDNSFFGDDSNDIAYGIEISYFSDMERSKKSLDNACRIMAALSNSWSVPLSRHKGHQEIQSDKIDPGNLLSACGYDRNRIDIILDKIYYYQSGDRPVAKVAKKVTEQTPIPDSMKDYRHEKGKFTANTNIITRYSGPSVLNRQAGTLKKGQSVIYDMVYTRGGYVWIKWTASNGKNIYMPIREFKNGKNGEMWGTIS